MWLYQNSNQSARTNKKTPKYILDIQNVYVVIKTDLLIF